MLDAEDEVRVGLWSSAVWQHLWLEDGQVSPVGEPAAPTRAPGRPDDTCGGEAGGPPP